MSDIPNLPTHIKKGHEVLFSQQDLTAREADLFGVMIAKMRPEDWMAGAPEYKFTAHELSEWLGITNRAIGSRLKPIVGRLSARRIGVVYEKNGDTEFEFTPLFKKAIYKNRVLTLIPNDALKNEYIEYNKGFALINTTSYLGLTREYSKRLYEILSRFKTGGRTLNPVPIDDLMSYMGILDESGNLKSDKQSFSNVSVMLARCVKDSIKEISTNPQTKKEILFHDGNAGLGIKYHKHGRKIHAVEFLYTWANSSTPIETAQVDSAKRIIINLEQKRLQFGEKLDLNELNHLADAYRFIGRDETAQEIERAINKDKQTEDEEFTQFMKFIENMNADNSY